MRWRSIQEPVVAEKPKATSCVSNLFTSARVLMMCAGREGGVVVEAQREGERVRGAVELDVRGHLPHETEVRQR